MVVDPNVIANPPQDVAPAVGGETPTAMPPPEPEPSIEEKIRAALSQGAGLEQLTALKDLIDKETARLRTEERERTEAVKKQRRAELVNRISETVDLGSQLSPFLADAKEAGLLGLVISFTGDTLSITPQSSAAPVARASAERKVAPDGQTPVRSPAGQSAEPGDEATWLAVTSEADRQVDLAAIEEEVAAAEGRGRTGKSVRNSITWRVRHDRIKLARSGVAVGHLKTNGGVATA